AGGQRPKQGDGGAATILSQILDQRVLAAILRNEFYQLGNDMAEPVDLSLTADVSGDAARILNVLMAVEHFPDCARLWTGWIPHVHREYERVASGIILEDYFARRIGKNAAIPIELAVD